MSGTLESPPTKKIKMEERKTFEVRDGVINKGESFEYLTIAHLAFDLTFDDEDINFDLSSNEKKMGLFDDIVLSMNNGKQKIGVQLKYTNKDGDVLTAKHLTIQNKKYDLRKYCESYNEIKTTEENLTAILYVRQIFDENKTFFIKCGKEGRIHVIAEKISIVHEFFKKTDPTCQCYKFLVVRGVQVPQQEVESYKQFFENFFLYTTQTSTEDIEQSISRKFRDKFTLKAKSKPYIDFIRNWRFQDKTKIKLDKPFLKKIIGLNLMTPFIKNFSFDGLPTKEEKLFLEATLEFAVTYVNENKKRIIIDLGINVLDQLPEETDCQNMRHDYQLGLNKALTNEDRTKLLWLTNKCPLIVSENELVFNVIKICCANMKFIVLSKQASNMENNGKFFRDLSNLRDKSVYNNILEHFYCQFQGRSINLKTLVSLNEEILKLIGPDELVLMMKNELDIGAKPEPLPEAYIERNLSRNIISENILDNVDINTIFLITADEQFKEKLNSFKTQNVITRDEKQTQKDFDDFCVKNPDKECHHLHFGGKDNFEWVRSNCSVRKLISYLCDDYISENELPPYEEDVNVNIVCGGPGMGKSIFLTNLLRSGTYSLWTIVLRVRNHSQYFRENDASWEKFENYLLDEYRQILDPFSYTVFKSFLNKSLVRILWDGLDELSNDNFETVKSVIQFAKNGTKHWVTSRDHLKRDLEEKFHVIARTLKGFEEKEQKQYILKRLNCSDNEAAKIFDKIKNNMKLFPNTNILEIPLQIYLLTQLLVQDYNKYSSLMDGVFTVVDLYEHFVEEKFKIYFKEKGEINIQPGSVQEVISNYFKKAHLDFYEKAALQLYFDENDLKDLDVESHGGPTKDEVSMVGFIVKITEGNIPEFMHNSFGEFFAASCLAKHSVKSSNFQNFVFDEKHNNIRFFLDLLLSEKSKAHIAVLYQNWALLDSCVDLDFERNDKVGRNCLQLMCLWGLQNKLPDIKFLQKSNLIETIKTKFLPKIKKNKEYIEKLELLSRKCNSFQNDQFFDIDKLCSTVKHQCYLTLGIVASLTKTDTDSFKIHKEDIFLNCVMHDYCGILKMAKTIPAISCNTEFPELHFVHFLVLFNSIKCMQEIFGNDLLNKQINMDVKNSDGKALIHYACEIGHLAIVEFLIEQGVNADVETNFKTRPMHYACQQKNWEVVKFLVENGVKADAGDQYGSTPLHEACQQGNLDSVKFLIGHGVNADVQTNFKTRPIHYACRQRHWEIVQFLIEMGVNADVGDQNGCTPMHDACRDGHLEMVKLLFEQGVRADVKDNFGRRPIHCACQQKHWKIVKFLVKKGVNADVSGQHGTTPIHEACQQGNLEIVSFLIQNGANANSADNYKARPIHYSCQNNHQKIVEFLIDKGVNSDVEDINRRTPIHYACLKGHLKIVELLIEKGINADVADKDGWKPIHYACQKGYLEIVKFLVKKGINATVEGQNKNTPLHEACREGHLEIVELLINKGVDADGGNVFKTRPIHYACQQGYLEIAKFLYNKEVDIEVGDRNERRPIHFACQNGHLEIVNFLITKEVNADIVDQYGWRPIHYACQKGDIRIVQFLFEMGVNVGAEGQNGSTPLHCACGQGHLEIVKFLIEKKLNADIEDNFKARPIHYAGRQRHWQIVKFLIEKGVNADVGDQHKITPLHEACHQGHLNIVRYLIEKGVKPDGEDNFKTMPLHYACQESHWEIFKFLVELGVNAGVGDQLGCTPMHYACQQGNLKLVKYLVEKGVDVNVENNFQERPIHCAYRKGHMKIVELLNARGINVDVGGKTTLANWLSS